MGEGEREREGKQWIGRNDIYCFAISFQRRVLLSALSFIKSH